MSAPAPQHKSSTAANPDRTVTSILAFPKGLNAYVDCFNAALESRGVKVCDGVLAGRWLLKNLPGYDYVHIHWPNHFYLYPSRWGCLRRFALFTFLLSLARWRGVSIIWTIHNLYPHERCVIPQLDRVGRWLMVRMAAHFLVHGPSAEAEAVQEFPRIAGRTILIDHGHWIGYYPDTMTRGAARAKLGLADSDFVFLFLGQCRPYKNLDVLVRTFGQLPGKPVLVIAGMFSEPEYESAVRREIERTGGSVILHSGFVADEELQVYLRACDAMVSPYREILTSGTAMLAFSFGRPMVAPARGFLKDMVVEGSGVLYDPSQPDGLQTAMLRAMEMKFDEARIVAHARTYDWGKSAERLLKVLESR